MRTALYARYSDDKQNPRSIEDQLALCQRHAESRGWAVAATFCDAAISGAAMANRPGLQALLARAEAGDFDRVLVEDTDRLARDREHDAHIFKRLTYARVIISTLTSDEVTPIESTFKGLMNELYLTNLSAKTKRGMNANAEKGLATGSRLYGYRSSPGGGMEIVPDQAAVIVRALTLFAGDGLTWREIADRFNRERIPSPRGGWWSASTLHGGRARANGFAHTELYAGVKVWNRMDVRKDPVTGKRRPVLKPRSEWRRTPVPHLRIVPEDLWARAQARIEAEGQVRPIALAQRRAAPNPFSGLLKCGFCGGGYTSYSRGRLVCAAHREKGAAVCANARTVDRAAVERGVLAGLQSRLLAPEAIEAYVREYHAAWAEEDRGRRADRAPIERRVAQLGRAIARGVDAYFDGRETGAERERRILLEDEKAALETRLAAMAAKSDAGPVTLHPSAARAYAAQVAELQTVLAEIAADRTALAEHRTLIEAARGLIIRVDITPRGPAATDPVDLRLHGDLARFLDPPEGAEGRGRGQVGQGGSWGRLHA